jgi:hypothetical protein
MGTEVEYGISVPGDPTANPVITSTQVVLAYAAAAEIPRSRRARWDYEVESPLRDARGFDLSAPTLHSPTAPGSTSTTPTPSSPRPRSSPPATPSSGTRRGSG